MGTHDHTRSTSSSNVTRSSYTSRAEVASRGKIIGFRSKILVEKPQTHNVVLGERKSHIFFRLGWCILADIVGEGGAGHEEEREDEARSKGMRFSL
jgi:hypothetical protein